MNTNLNVSKALSLLTYNSNQIVIPKEKKLNQVIGLGLWSAGFGLSVGLPIEVMQMLLSAAIMRSQILGANPSKPSKIIVLIADSMAIREGAEINKVSQLIHIYKRSLESLLDLLNLKESSEIILSSELEKSNQFKEDLETVENTSIVKELKNEDELHYAYVRTQTAISLFVNTRMDVGIKVGWIYAESSKQLNSRVKAQNLKKWDELKFDQWCKEICEASTLQYLYTKAGLKLTGSNKSINIIEGCPYTAFSSDRRFLIQAKEKKDIKEIAPILKKVTKHWEGVAEVCCDLMQEGLAKNTLLPKDCIKKSYLSATVYNMLNHWTNFPVIASVSEQLSKWDSYNVFSLVDLRGKSPLQDRCVLL